MLSKNLVLLVRDIKEMLISVRTMLRYRGAPNPEHRVRSLPTNKYRLRLLLLRVLRHLCTLFYHKWCLQDSATAVSELLAPTTMFLLLRTYVHMPLGFRAGID